MTELTPTEKKIKELLRMLAVANNVVYVRVNSDYLKITTASYDSTYYVTHLVLHDDILKTIEEILIYEDLDFRCALAENNYTSKEIRKILLKDPSLEVRLRLVSNENITIESLIHLARDKVRSVRKAVTNHPQWNKIKDIIENENRKDKPTPKEEVK